MAKKKQPAGHAGPYYEIPLSACASFFREPIFSPMKTISSLRCIFTMLLVCTTCAVGAPLETAIIESTTGLKGTLNEAEGVFKVSAPRADVKVTVDGWQMPPFMGLTSWAGFVDGKSSQAMVMGDIVLLQDELNPAMSAALDAGLEVTALHN